MGLMDAIRRMAQKRNEKKEKFKQLQEDDRLMTLLEERKKSANRRELEKYYRDKEEAEIKRTLDQIRKRQSRESWKSKNSILKKEKSILKDDRPILKEKNIFTNEKNIFIDNKSDIPFVSQRGMFFKW